MSHSCQTGGSCECEGSCKTIDTGAMAERLAKELINKKVLKSRRSSTSSLTKKQHRR